MTPAELPPIEEFELQDPAVLGTVTFRGHRLAHVSTRRAFYRDDKGVERERQRPRWTEMTLYSVVESKYAYVLYIEGLSVLTHRIGSSCDKGVAMSVDDLPQDAEACPECRPDLTAGRVSFEEDRLTLYRDETVNDVLRDLKASRNKSATALSNPAMRLIQEASALDPAFRSDQRFETL